MVFELYVAVAMPRTTSSPLSIVPLAHDVDVLVDRETGIKGENGEKTPSQSEGSDELEK